MSNIFDNMQKAAVGIVHNTFGYDATWRPSLSPEQELTARVLFKAPTKEYELGQLEYSATTFLMEYFTPDFPGLADSANNGGAEKVTIEGVVYFVSQVLAVHDGKTFKAILQKV